MPYDYGWNNSCTILPPDSPSLLPVAENKYKDNNNKIGPRTSGVTGETGPELSPVSSRGPDGGLSEILCLSPWAGTSRSPVPVCSSLLQARTEWCTCETAREAVHARQGEPFVGGQACALFGRSDTRGRISQAGNQRSRSGVWDDHSSASVWLQHTAHGFQLRDVEIRDVGSE